MTEKIRIIALAALLFAGFSARPFQQTDPQDSVNISQIPSDWFLMDPETDRIPGSGADRAYALLDGRTSRTVLVAIIDSGIDIDHEDLRDKIWVNEDEIPGNGIDDDHNGYIDDIHGWNFIGGNNGANVDADTYEVTREYARLKGKYEQIPESKIKRKDRDEYAYWKKVKAKYDRDFKNSREQYDLFKKQFLTYYNVHRKLFLADSLIKSRFGVSDVTPEVLAQVDNTNDTLASARDDVQLLFDNIPGVTSLNEILSELQSALVQLQDGIVHFGTAVEFGYNTEFNSRTIVGDDPSNLRETGYGNNDVTGPDPMHGTHVAGIIGADRDNDLGVRGIGDNIRIMSVRTVPNGDERDKDVANAIRYAVDNGARVVNMSFGKSLSPHKELVDDAVKYAESKGVLLVHAAGNDGDNNDTEPNYPNRRYNNGGEAANWLEIGASAWSVDEHFAAAFSNYGKKSVDLFAPGVDIVSTLPHDNYDAKEGTSMASPMVTGVAALIMSYFPNLTDVEVRDILKQSAHAYAQKVIRPGTKDQTVPFTSLSITGGIVDAHRAVELALRMEEGSK